MKIIGRLILLMIPFSNWVFYSILLGAATAISGVGLMGTSAYLIARAALHPSVAVLQVAIVGVRFFGISRGIFRYLERLTSHAVNFRLLANLRVWFYRKIEPLSPAILDSYQSGDVLSRAVSDIETLENFYVRSVSPAIVMMVITIVVGWFVGQYDLIFSIILVSGLLLGGFGVPLLIYLISKTPGREVINSRSALQTALVDAVQGLSDLTAFGQKEEKFAELNQLSLNNETDQIRLALRGALSGALNLLVAQLSMWGVLLVGANLVFAGRLDGVSLAVLVLITLASFEVTQPMGTAARNLESSIQAAKRIFDLADRKPAVNQPTKPQFHIPHTYLEVDGLTFSYKKDQANILEEIYFELPPGKQMAIVGPSGAGKSTLLHLLMRFWDFEKGNIFIGGHDIRTYDLETVRKQFGMVSQTTFLFSGTLRQNLLLAKPEATENQLLQVLQQSELMDWVEILPSGLDTWIGERGMQISGGERQRIAIARTLLSENKVLLLDEPTANLDAITEQKIIQTLGNISHRKSVLWVTHRLTGLDRMDEILVLNHGDIVERGTQAQLLQAGGFYFRMWSQQHDFLGD